MARDTAFVALAAITLMAGFSFEPAFACKIGATVALVFSVGLLARAYFLTEERLLGGEVWRALTSEERPAGAQARQWARAQMELLLLRFAKGASGAAGLLYCSALLLALMAGAGPPDLPGPHQFVSAGHSELALK